MMENNHTSKIELKRQIKRKHLIDALKACLQKNVYSQISLEDIAKEAGLSKGGLRHYFPTREELYMGLIEDFFNQIQIDHIDVIKGLESDGEDRAFISTLFGIERFLLDKDNIRVFINLILYGFEDEKIMLPIRQFVSNHLSLYKEIIADCRGSEPDKDKDTVYIGRITQIILLCAGILESIDPINMDTPRLVDYMLKIFQLKGSD